MAEFPATPDSPDEMRLTPSRKPGNGPLLAVIVLGLLLVGGLVFALYYFLTGRSAVDSEMLAFLPAESTMIVGADVESLQKNARLKDVFTKNTPNGKDPLKELNEQLKDTGLTTEDFTKILIGVDPAKGEPTVVFRTRKSFDKQKMAATMEFKEEKKAGDKTYWVNGRKDRLFFPTDNLIVVTTEANVEGLLAKNPSQVVVSEEMQGLCKKMGKGDAWLVVSNKALPPEFAKNIDEAKKGRVPYAPPALLDLVKDGKAAGFYVKVDDDRIKFKAGIVGSSKEKAEAAEKEMKAEIKDRKDKKLEDDALVGKEFSQAPDDLKKFVADVQKSLDVDRDGDTLELSWEFSISGLETAVKAMTGWQMQKREVQIQRLEVEHRHAIDRDIKARMGEIERAVPKFELDAPEEAARLRERLLKEQEKELKNNVGDVPPPNKK